MAAVATLDADLADIELELEDDEPSSAIQNRRLLVRRAPASPLPPRGQFLLSSGRFPCCCI
eukprot:COSAG01_NODE_4620_length_4873_cov_21.709677_1_plen_61_part_00